MGSARVSRILSLIIMIAILVNLGVNVLAPARATFSGPPRIFIVLPTSGPSFQTGTVSTASIAVAAFFSDSTGKGGFAGQWSNPFPFTVNKVSGVFTLTATSSDLIPLIPCVSGEVGAVGTIIAGNFTGQTLIVFGCTGTGTLGGMRIIDRSGSITYDGLGVGNAAVPGSTILVGGAIAGNTGGGSFGASENEDVAQVLALDSTGRVHTGGALIGSHPYTYSDSTGWVVRSITSHRGVWTVTQFCGQGSCQTSVPTVSTITTTVSRLNCSTLTSSCQVVLGLTLESPQSNTPLYRGGGIGQMVGGLLGGG